MATFKKNAEEKDEEKKVYGPGMVQKVLDQLARYENFIGKVEGIKGSVLEAFETAAKEREKLIAVEEAKKREEEEHR